MTIRQREVGDVVVLDVQGKIMGGPDSETFQLAVQENLDRGIRKLLVNLENCHWINSTGLGILIAGLTAMTRGGGKLKLVHATERVESLLMVTKLSTIFESYQREDEALQSFRT